MNPWSALVHLVQRGINGTAGLVGGNTLLGIFLLTLAVRLVLIPILLPLARRTRAWRAVHRTIKPEIKAINKEHKDDATKAQAELKALHARNGIGIVDSAGLYMALVQVPLLIAFFQAVIEMSGGTPLASGGLVYGLVAGALSWAGAFLGDATTAKPLLWFAALAPIGIAAWLGAGVGGYLTAFYLGTLVQSLLVRRTDTTAAAT